MRYRVPNDRIRIWKRPDGYYNIRIGRGPLQLLHRYVWELFNGRIPAGYDIHHKNENKNCNCIANLELLEHGQHRREHHKTGVSCAPKRIRCVETGEVYRSIIAAGKAKQVNPSGISAQLHGRYRTAAGHHWEFMPD